VKNNLISTEKKFHCSYSYIVSVQNRISNNTECIQRYKTACAMSKIHNNIMKQAHSSGCFVYIPY